MSQVVQDWSKYHPYFLKEEFNCSHTGENKMDSNFMDTLLMIRTRYNKPMLVTSGYRSPTHPVEARKEQAGEHCLGMAVDVSVVNSQDRFELIQLILTKFPVITRLGVSKNFIHIGMSKNLPQNVMWTY